MSIITTDSLCKTYETASQQVYALDHVNLSIEKGEFVSIIGASGSGKSTLLHLLGGLDTPTSGSIVINGMDITDLQVNELARFRRRKIGFVFQSYNLVTSLTVCENIVLPIGLDNREADRLFLKQVVETLHIQDKLDRMPNTLSGGQQQRVAIARALIAKPAILLADEPTGNLDRTNSLEVVALLKASAERFGQTIAMVTHSQELAKLSDRRIQIEDGRIKEE